jgi:hypothetical protein
VPLRATSERIKEAGFVHKRRRECQSAFAECSLQAPCGTREIGCTASIYVAASNERGKQGKINATAQSGEAKKGDWLDAGKCHSIADKCGASCLSLFFDGTLARWKWDRHLIYAVGNRRVFAAILR